MIEITPEYLASQGLSPTFPQRFWAKVNKNGPVPVHCPELGPCWVWTAHTVKGYGEIGRGTAQDGDTYAHRASWILHFGPIPNGTHICHRCDNAICVRPTHLFAGTAADNIHDMMEKGRNRTYDRRGEQNPKVRLTWDEVRMIRRLHADGISEVKLAKNFAVNSGTIWFIVRNRTWVE